MPPTPVRARADGEGRGLVKLLLDGKAKVLHIQRHLKEADAGRSAQTRILLVLGKAYESEPNTEAVLVSSWRPGFASFS